MTYALKITLIGALVAAPFSPVFAQDRRAVDSNRHGDGPVTSYAAPAQNQTSAPDAALEPAVTVDGLLKNADELLQATKRDIDCANAQHC